MSTAIDRFSRSPGFDKTQLFLHFISIEKFNFVLNKTRLKGNLSKMRDLSRALHRAQENALDQQAKYGDERFGSFFRVKFYGERFPDEIKNQEYVFREGMAAKLSEVSEKIKAEAELLTDVPVRARKHVNLVLIFEDIF